MTPRRQLDPTPLELLAARQHRCLSLRQLSDLGVPSSTIAYRTKALDGMWSRPLPGVVLLHTGTPTPDERASAALLYAGEGAVLTGLESLRRHGLRRLPPIELVHVLIPQERRRVGVAFTVCERTERLPAADPVTGLPCAPVARALVDVGRRIDRLDQVRAMTAEAVQRRLCTQQALLAELATAQRRRTARIRLVAAEIVGGIRSAAEADTQRVLQREGFPPALWNHDLYTPDGQFIGCPDAWFDEEGVALEVDSREWHLDPHWWEQTQTKRARFASYGIPSVPVTPRRLHQDLPEFVRDLHMTLGSAVTRTRPDVIAVMRSQAA